MTKAPVVAYARLASAASLLLALIVLGILAGTVYLTGRPPAPKSKHASPETFSAARAIATLKEIIPPRQPHPLGSEANARVRERLVTTLIGMGFNVDTQAAFSCSSKWAVCAPVQNVIATLPGKTPGPAVLLAAHYDSVPAGPGIADDGNGVATLLETARALKREAPLHNPVIFLFTDGEEAGLLGAEAFIKQSIWRRQVGVVLNFEARGTTGPSLMFETSGSNRWLIRTLAKAARRPDTASYMTAVYQRMPNDTDLSVFKHAGLAGMNFAFAGGRPRYHTSLDNYAHLDAASVQHQGDNALATARALARRDLGEPHQQDAVFTDIFAHWLVWWPAAWTLPMAALAAFAGLAAMLWLGYSSRLRLREFAWGLGAWWGVLLTPAALGLALVALVRWITGVAQPWHAHPLAMTVALWLTVPVGGGLIAIAAAKRAGVWGLVCGSLSWWCLAALALGASLPAFDSAVLIPAAIGSAALLLVVLTGASRSTLAAAGVSIITALAIGMLWFKIALLMPVMFGLGLSSAVTAPLGLIFTAVTPLFAVAPRRGQARRWVIGVSGVAMGLALATAVRVPFYPPARPIPLNITYLENAASGKAMWSAGRPRMKLPAKLKAAKLFSKRAASFVPWQREASYLAKAKPWHQPGPALDLVRSIQHGHTRTLTLRLRSRRHARTAMLFVPTRRRVLSAKLNGRALAWMISPPGAKASGYHSITIAALPRTGVKLSLKLAGRAPVKLIAADRAAKLPPLAKPLLAARPSNYMPKGYGDSSILYSAKRF